ncbi:uncharacterized protein [Antedon mediterranea]|uniref:uncharacterized protein n=1 Tax=Antedon mediterranea TaxID=105859 RepID=UPI003AF83C62
MSEESPAPKRVRLSNEDMSLLSKEELIAKCLELEMYANEVEKKQSETYCAGDTSAEEKWKQHQIENSRKEKVLVMRLTTKEQEVQELAADLAKAQNPSTSQLRNSLLDPAINLLFQKMRKETGDSKTKLQQANDDMAAWKFTPDSQTGKRLMSKCRALFLENQELGKQISSGKTAQLEAELALQKKYSEELKTSQDELNEFVIELDEEVEGMQSTICTLQQQLKETTEELNKYKNQNNLENTNGQHNILLENASDESYKQTEIKAEQYNSPERTESGPFTISASKLTVEENIDEHDDEGYRTTHTECANTGTPVDVTEQKLSANVNEIEPDENRQSDFFPQQYVEDENADEDEEKYGWEGENQDLRNSEEKDAKYTEDIPVNDSKTVEEKPADVEHHQLRTDTVSDVRLIADDNDDDTGNETPSYGELSDTEQTDNKLTGTEQLVCKFESTYKPNNILTVDPIQKSLPIESDEDDNIKTGIRTDSPVNGRALEHNTLTLPALDAKISLVDGYSSDDGGGSIELSTTTSKATSYEQNGLHKLSDGIEDECMDTD